MPPRPVLPEQLHGESFVVVVCYFGCLEALKEAAAMKGISIEDLMPPSEFDQYVRVKSQ
jgi:hypothetical protein